MSEENSDGGIPQGRIVSSRKDLNYWLEYKEAFVLRRWFQRIPDTNLFPVMIIDQMNKGDQLDHSEIKYYLLEYDYDTYMREQWNKQWNGGNGQNDYGHKDNGVQDEERMNYLEEIGFLHICYSKDDLPIFIYQNKKII